MHCVIGTSVNTGRLLTLFTNYGDSCCRGLAIFHRGIEYMAVKAGR
jgi:hypothetical protein